MSTINRVFVGIAAGAVLYFVGSGAGVLLLGGASDGNHPTDNELLARFQSNRAAFDQLIAMSDSDAHVIRITPDFTTLDPKWQWPTPNSRLGFSVDRWNQYRKLFSQLRLGAGLSRDSLSDNTVVIHFTAHSMGIVNRGSWKGYAYSSHQLGPLVSSLDDGSAFRTEHRHAAGYRRIEGNWYLALDW